MPWGFFKRIFNFFGGKILGKLAPRLLIFQYYDRASLQIQQQKKKYKLYYKYYKNQAYWKLYTIDLKKQKSGISSILNEPQDNSTMVSALQINGRKEDDWDTKTVFSQYQDNGSQYQFLQMSLIEDSDNS